METINSALSGSALNGLEPLLSIEELAEYLGVPVTTIRDWRTDGKGPCAIKVGGRVRFATSDVVAALRSADPISRQEMKDVEQMAGLRNSAAHGDFDEISRERAGLMEQQVNYLLIRLTERFDS